MFDVDYYTEWVNICRVNVSFSRRQRTGSYNQREGKKPPLDEGDRGTLIRHPVTLEPRARGVKVLISDRTRDLNSRDETRIAFRTSLFPSSLFSDFDGPLMEPNLDDSRGFFEKCFFERFAFNVVWFWKPQIHILLILRIKLRKYIIKYNWTSWGVEIIIFVIHLSCEL